ncbi:hypothetical protein DKP78_14810, partial [Enterococcus faecium]
MNVGMCGGLRIGECLRVHCQLQPLLDVDLNGAIVVLVERLKCTAHGVEPDQAANVVVKVHVAVFITVSADDHLEELLIQGEACSFE